MITFNYNHKTYTADWTDGYVKLPHGSYLEAEKFVDGKPINIFQVKLMVAPTNFTVATEVT